MTSALNDSRPGCLASRAFSVSRRSLRLPPPAPVTAMMPPVMPVMPPPIVPMVPAPVMPMVMAPPSMMPAAVRPEPIIWRREQQEGVTVVVVPPVAVMPVAIVPVMMAPAAMVHHFLLRLRLVLGVGRRRGRRLRHRRRRHGGRCRSLGAGADAGAQQNYGGEAAKPFRGHPYLPFVNHAPTSSAATARSPCRSGATAVPAGNHSRDTATVPAADRPAAAAAAGASAPQDRSTGPPGSDVRGRPRPARRQAPARKPLPPMRS